MDEMQSLPPDTHIGSVHLKVSNLKKSLSFYVDILGFKEVEWESEPGAASEQTAETVLLSADGNYPALILLTEQPEAIQKPKYTTGLYHIAIRVPSQRALGKELAHVQQMGWRFDGAADHLVSEALYLADPDGNGLEIYADRERERWPYSGDQVVMATEPLDVDGLMRAAAESEPSYEGIHPNTVIGHVHLQVADLSQAESFYHGLLGFDITQRSYPGALFLSAGGYHHHIGLNIWAGKGATPPPPNAVGLKSFTIVIPNGEAWQYVLDRLQKASVAIEAWHSEGGLVKALVEDPFQNGVELAVEKDLLSSRNVGAKL
jgi:catechol 2,3-dioxygenase